MLTRGLLWALVIQCAGADVLRDDAFAYAEALREAGVRVEMYAYKGLPHCFPALLPTTAETAEFYRRYTRFVADLTQGPSFVAHGPSISEQ